MKPNQSDRRGARRYELQLVVTLDGAQCESRNLSSTGLYVLSPQAFEQGSEVPIEVFFPELPGHMKWVRGIGRVTRAVSEDHLTGLGIQLKAWHFA